MIFTRPTISLLLFTGLVQTTHVTLGAQTARHEVPFNAVVESIEFKNLAPATQQMILDRIGLRRGDALTVEARHRIGRELGSIGKGLTFRYKSGSKPGTAKVIIDGDC